MNEVRRARGTAARRSGRKAEWWAAVYLMLKGYRVLGFRLKTAAADAVDVRLQLLPDDREVGERRVQEPVLQVGVAAEQHAQHGDEHQQQREEGQEGEEGQQGTEIPGLVVAELLHHGDGVRQHGVALLEMVDPVQERSKIRHEVPSRWRGDCEAAWDPPGVR